MEQILSKWVDQAVRFSPRLGASIAIFFFFWLGAVLLGNIVHHFGKRSRTDSDILEFVRRVVKIGVLVFGLITALGTLNINVSALVAGLGLTGFALGFALKDILSNLIAGILILIYHPFHREDHIDMAGNDGIVADIDLRYTTLQGEGKKILIPNSNLFTNPVIIREIEKTREPP